ncbi:MAG: adenylate/guanylate cyclase domain-containing protein [Rubrivivax sp.]
MNEAQQIEAGIAALEAQRSLLGDAVVDIALAPLRAKLLALQSANSTARALPAQQLKQTSVLFVDVVGSTAMGDKLEPEDIQAIMDGALERFTTIVEKHKGRVLQYTGDGMLAAFGADEGHENDPELAIRAALDILAATRQASASAVARHGVAGFNVRAGINTGSVLLGGGVDAEGSIRGSTVNIAARMEQSAPPGGLRISHDTYRHVRGLFKVTEEPPLQVKGRDEPLQTYLVQHARPRAFRIVTRGIEGLETRMVGRDAELEQLQQAFHALYRTPRFHAVTVVADAGVGKSRLMYEFENWADARVENFTTFRGRAQPPTQTQPYGLLRDVLAWRLHILDSDDAETARNKLVAGIAPLLVEDGQAQAHLLGQLIGLDFSASPHVRGILGDARQIRNRAFHAAAQVLRLSAAGEGMPLLLLLDELHWADDGSLDFINYLVQVNRDVPMLMIGLTRPTLYERRPHWASVESVYSRIDLSPLDKRASRELANELLQRLDAVPAALREVVIGGAEGNPFYMEELVRMLIDDGVIVPGAERWRLVEHKLLAAHVPPTLTGVLQARLDSLPPSEKLALQQAAAIGFVFWDQTLAALDARSVQALDSLVKRSLVVPREHTALDGLTEFAFKHQILHQVTYDSLLKRQRLDFHARIADWMAHFGGDRQGETLGPTAEHYERAGDTANACSFYARAAENAAARHASEAMLAYVNRALPLLAPSDLATRWRLILLREGCLLYQDDRQAHAEALDELARLAEALSDDARRVEVEHRRAAAANSAGDPAAAERAAHRGLALARRIDHRAMLEPLFSQLCAALIAEGRHADALRHAEEGLEIARSQGDRQGQSSLNNIIGLIAMEQGDLLRAAQLFERSLLAERETGNHARQGLLLNNLGSVYPRMGDYARARAHLDDGLKLARSIGRRDTEAIVLVNLASVAHLQGDDASALAFANAAFDGAVAIAQPDVQAFARLVAGHAELALGRYAEAHAAYQHSRELLEPLNMRPQQVLDPLAGLARVLLEQGRLDEALDCVEAVLTHLSGGGSLDGTEEPLRIPLTCYAVLAAMNDARAQSVLADAHAELQSLAARLGEAQARHGFLNLVPHHREIVRAWAARHAQA